MSKKEVDTITKWYQPMPKVAGVDWSYRLSYGSEPYWPRWLSTPATRRGVYYLFLDNLYQHIIFDKDPQAKFSALDFQAARDLPKMVNSRAMNQAYNPDLSAFKAAGGKAILYQGWSDPGAVPEAAIGYYQDVVKHMKGAAQTNDFLRLFMVPGAGHCFEAPHGAPDQFNALVSLENWVENGVAPSKIITEKRGEDGKLIRSRPLCPYPQQARYKGKNSIDDADKFYCATP